MSGSTSHGHPTNNNWLNKRAPAAVWLAICDWRNMLNSNVAELFILWLKLFQFKISILIK